MYERRNVNVWTLDSPLTKSAASGPDFVEKIDLSSHQGGPGIPNGWKSVQLNPLNSRVPSTEPLESFHRDSFVVA